MELYTYAPSTDDNIVRQVGLTEMVGIPLLTSGGVTYLAAFRSKVWMSKYLHYSIREGISDNCGYTLYLLELPEDKFFIERAEIELDSGFTFKVEMVYPVSIPCKYIRVAGEANKTKIDGNKFS